MIVLENEVLWAHLQGGYIGVLGKGKKENGGEKGTERKREDEERIRKNDSGGERGEKRCETHLQYLVAQIALCMTHRARGYMKVSKYQISSCILPKDI